MTEVLSLLWWSGGDLKPIHFHLPTCEMSITLQDIAIITGLPIDGNAVCRTTNLDWGTVCENLLKVTPPATTLAYGSLKITWVRSTFSSLPEGVNAITTEQYARAYMFQVLAAKVDCIATFSSC